MGLVFGFGSLQSKMDLALYALLQAWRLSTSMLNWVTIEIMP